MTLHKFIFIAIGMMFMLLQTSAFSQVTIRDTIVINSKSSRSLSDASNPLVVTFRYIYHSCGTSPLPVCSLQGPCDSYTQTKTGNTTYPLNNDITNTIEFDFTPYDPGIYRMIVQTLPPHWSDAYCGSGSANTDGKLDVVDNQGYENYTSAGGVGSMIGYVYNGNCVASDLQPQTAQDLNIEKYNEGSYFDPQDGGLSYIVSGCPLPSSWFNSTSDDTLGVTFMIKYMPNNLPPNNQTWSPIQSNSLTLCFDAAQNVWRIRLHGLRIPIFSSACFNKYENINDGCNDAVLAQHITSKSLYEIALHDLRWWLEGSYSHPNEHPERFYFQTGIEKHESLHFTRDSAAVVKEYSLALQNIFNSPIPKATNPCYSDASTGGRVVVNPMLTNAWNAAYNRFGDNKIEVNQNKQKEDADADLNARSEYTRILGCLTTWATTQVWYNN